VSNESATPSEQPTPLRSMHQGDVVVHAVEGTLVVLDHQLTVQRTGSERQVTWRASEIRRVQVDIELRRPATIAIVPNSAAEAQLLTVEPDQFEQLSRALLHLALELDDASRRLAD
jgi:hypothetical protein